MFENYIPPNIDPSLYKSEIETPFQAKVRKNPLEGFRSSDNIEEILSNMFLKDVYYPQIKFVDANTLKSIPLISCQTILKSFILEPLTETCTRKSLKGEERVTVRNTGYNLSLEYFQQTDLYHQFSKLCSTNFLVAIYTDKLAYCMAPRIEDFGTQYVKIYLSDIITITNN